LYKELPQALLKDEKMKAAVIAGPARFEVTDVPVPEINENQILVRILMCGVCMSEYPRWKTGLETGEILGHEPIGIVEKTGKMVRGFSEGDRVTGLFFHSFAEYVVADPGMTVKLPDDVSDVEGILEPWSCLISGAERTSVNYGSSVAIVGCGYMGLGFLQLMKIKCAGKITAVDVRAESLENAHRFGAHESYTPENLPPEYIVDVWNDRMFIDGTDVVIEAGGNAETLELAGKMVRPHGILAVVGYHQSGGGRRDVDMGLWNWKAIDVINAHERRPAVQRECFLQAIKLIQSKQLRIKEMMTHEYGLADINQAFRELKEKPAGYIKGYIRLQV
jgi:threonine dehydrogenase-like Zn-dependent dehydrogenase